MKTFESELGRIPDVLAVRSVKLDDEHQEIRVLASPDRTAQEITSDIESLAVLRGVTLRPDDIHIVQLHPIRDEPRPSVKWGGQDAPSAPAAKTPTTPTSKEEVEIDGVVVVTGEGSARALVTVRLGDQVATGTAVFVPAGVALRRGVADATLRAMLEVLDAHDEIAVDTALAIPVPPHEVALVILAVVNGAGEQVLVGSALVRSAGVNDAIASAVVDATSRWFGRHADPPR